VIATVEDSAPVAGRNLHPVAWWAWGLLVGAAALRIRNPLLTGLLVASIWVVVAARRPSAPWSRSFGLFVRVGVFVVAVRVVLQMVFGARLPGRVLFTLPEADLPDWAAGVALGGPVTAESLVGAVYASLPLLGLLAAVGAANSLADPYRLLRTLPAALHEAGVAVSVALLVAPQAVVSAGEVREARRLRGRPINGWSGLRGTALPVLEGALDRSVALAASMDSRGFGRPGAATDPRRLRRARAASAAGLLAVAVATYGVLDAGTPGVLGVPLMVVGAALLVTALAAHGRGGGRTRYRPDPWRWEAWATVGSGVLVLAVVVGAGSDGGALDAPRGLAWPSLAVVPAVAVVAAALPAWLTPEPAA
ncbi:MAG TPA: energy-coupling factor transporter transmembrane component T, partial [Acidimicrobiia bacterium]|nr:energy-coupling factor transporter transmembrane component T [Acidimicrobiia bacterium]